MNYCIPTIGGCPLAISPGFFPVNNSLIPPHKMVSQIKSPPPDV